jgi:parallel beta-helix repeat protein
LSGGDGNLIEGNIITNNLCAIRNDGSSNANIISNNTIVDNSYGIYVFAGQNYSIVGNEIINNTELGIYIWFMSGGNNILANLIAGSYYGIKYHYFISYSAIAGNTIAGNAYGIHLDNTASSIRIFHNSFVNNTLQAYCAGDAVWDDGYPSGGNYWSDSDGVDLFSGPFQNETGSDGIVDTPYLIGAADGFPLTKPYGGVFDVGVRDLHLSQLVVPEGLCMDISMKIINYGLNSDTLNLTIRANETLIYAETIPLASRNSSNVAYTWNTTGYARGNYTLTIAADVQDDNDTSDNLFTFPIRISKPGDLTGDDYVGIDDLFTAAQCFGSEPGHPRWNAEADLNQDRYVGIDDIFKIAGRFGQEG